MDLADDGGVGAEARRERISIEDLYRLHAPGARRLAYLLTGSREVAEDLTQDAFVRVIGRLAHLRDQDGFGLYLRRTVVNQTRMHFRRRAVERRHAAREHTTSSSQVQDVAESEALRGALLRLPYRQRAAIVLRFYVDLPDDETAEVLDCAVGTVRSLISRGMASLRDVLGGEDLG